MSIAPYLPFTANDVIARRIAILDELIRARKHRESRREMRLDDLKTAKKEIPWLFTMVEKAQPLDHELQPQPTMFLNRFPLHWWRGLLSDILSLNIRFC